MSWTTTPTARRILAQIPNGEISPHVVQPIVGPRETRLMTSSDTERKLQRVREDYAAKLLGYDWQDCGHVNYDRERCLAFIDACGADIHEALAEEVARRCGDRRAA